MGTDLSIVDFITARVEEDEVIARRASTVVPAPWRYVEERNVILDAHNLDLGLRVGYVEGQHIPRHDPARVLREVAAKRQILAEHRRVDSRPDWPGGPEPACHGCGAGKRSWEEYAVPDVNDCPVLRALASVWAGHADFRAEWSVTE